MQRSELKISGDQAIWLLVGFDSVLILAAFALGESAGAALLATIGGVVLGVVAALFYMRPRRWAGPTLEALPQDLQSRAYASEQPAVSTPQQASKPATRSSSVAQSAGTSKSVVNVW